MKQFFTILLVLSAPLLYSQKLTMAQMKEGMQKAQNPVAYAREVLKKKYKIDTVTITNTSHFMSVADSLAYRGKQGMVYGPIDKKYLVMILGKAPNTFTRVSQIFLDTTMFHKPVADSLANSIIGRIAAGIASFETMAQTYSMGGEGATKGDLGWIARGSILPAIDKELALRKKGDIFKVWSPAGLHIIKKTADPKQDSGFALMLRVFL